MTVRRGGCCRSMHSWCSTWANMWLLNSWLKKIQSSAIEPFFLCKWSWNCEYEIPFLGTFLMTFLHTPYMSQMPVNLFVVSSMCMYFLQDDVKLMVETGLEAYRFSISWSRLIPSKITILSFLLWEQELGHFLVLSQSCYSYCSNRWKRTCQSKGFSLLQQPYQWTSQPWLSQISVIYVFWLSFWKYFSWLW